MIARTMGLTAAAAGAAGLLFSALSEPFDGLWIQVSLNAGSTCLSVWVWQRALVLSAFGRARWLAAINLLPSLVAIPLLLVVQDSPAPTKVAVLLIAQAIGFALYGALIERRSRALDLTDGAPAVQHDRRSSGWFLGQSVAAYSSAVAIQSVGATLAPPSLTIYGIASRFVAAGASVVSAVLPVIVNRSTSESRRARQFSWLSVLLGLVGTIATAAIPLPARWEEFRLTAVIAVVWVSAVAVNGALHRLAFRFYPPRLSLITIVVSPTIALVAVASAFYDASLHSVLWALVLLDLLSAIGFAIALRFYLLAGALGLFGILSIVLTGHA